MSDIEKVQVVFKKWKMLMENIWSLRNEEGKEKRKEEEKKKE